MLMSWLSFAVQYEEGNYKTQHNFGAQTLTYCDRAVFDFLLTKRVGILIALPMIVVS